MSTITLTVQEIIGANAGLAALDGFNKIVGENPPTRIPYKFDDSTRWNIAKDKKILAKEVELFQEATNALIMELSPAQSDINKEESPVREQFRVRQKALLELAVELTGLLKIKKASLLRDDANPIPGTVLEVLMPIIDDGTTEPKPPQPEGGDK